MKMQIAAACLLSSLAGAPALAMLPDSGLWGNTAESGRGFTIDIQNSTLVLTGYIYDAYGNPMWIVSAGQMSSDSVYSGSYSTFSGGQCLGCAYQSPTQHVEGTLSLNFIHERLATLTIGSLVINITRTDVGMGGSPDYLFGEWALVDGSSQFFAERLTFDKDSAPADGSAHSAAGNRSGWTGGNYTVLGKLDVASGLWIIVLDSSASSYQAWSFKPGGLSKFEGTHYTYLKTALPTTGEPFVAFRTRSRGKVVTGIGPGTDKALALPDYEATDRARVAASGVPITDADLRAIITMTREYEQTRGSAR